MMPPGRENVRVLEMIEEFVDFSLVNSYVARASRAAFFSLHGERRQKKDIQ